MILFSPAAALLTQQQQQQQKQQKKRGGENDSSDSSSSGMVALQMTHIPMFRQPHDYQARAPAADCLPCSLLACLSVRGALSA